MSFNPFAGKGGGAKAAAGGSEPNPFGKDAKGGAAGAGSSALGGGGGGSGTPTTPGGGASGGGGAPLVSGTPSRLASAPINLSALRDDAFRELTELLEKLPGRILLVVDPALVAPLKLVVAEGSKALREHRVEALVELAPPGGQPLATDCDSVMYLTRPAHGVVQAIGAQVRALVRRWDAGKTVRKQLTLAFVPRRTFIAEQLLRDEHGELVVSHGVVGGTGALRSYHRLTAGAR
jgi:hypothetical protein